MSHTSEKTPAELFATPVQFLKGVGPQHAELLAKLDLHTARDVIFFFPRDYQDLTDLTDVSELSEESLVRVHGTVVELDQRNTSSGGTMLGALVRCTGGNIRALWFNQPFMVRRLPPGQELLLSGKAKWRGGIWEMVHPDVKWIDSDDTDARGKVLPVYPLTEALSQPAIRRIVAGVVETLVGHLDEVFPAEFLEAHNLAPIREAVEQIHNPANRESLARARRRFVYQELLVMQLALAIKRHTQHELRRAPPLAATAKIDARIRRLFPFELTPGQNKMIDEIAADMAREHPMNRLLQGDVGSGKTAVAVYALLLAIAHGQQAALMAPTELLARQHAGTIEGFLTASRVRWGLLTGALSPAERRDTLAKIAAGELDLVVGTQAIVQADVEFAKLGLVVIDEQHKFGVRQRASLKQAGLDPHYLVMTATPIPRTVAMTMFGDLDVSTLRDAPPGRQTVHTYLATPEQREKWWDFFRRKLREGRQGYVVVPLVESSEDAAATSIDQSYESLANGPLEAFRLALVHGRMSAAEKATVMDDFRRGATQVLVSTTVVEVGVDVPNATLLAIESGQCFGLAQLHQLRGRISRGAYPGYCCVFAEPISPESQKRLESFARSTDGFELAEIDFLLRGPGDLLGTRQHGMPPLRIADPVADAAVLEEARRDAQQLVAADPGLAHPEHERLRRMVLVRYGQVLDLGDVG
ncbi:MAG: ATP-dependent DNA helicase RecG [Planctomycetia bacterium]|nr:ATP-dependent DNA helicase RecG [Planctomycetia bacterium]